MSYHFAPRVSCDAIFPQSLSTTISTDHKELQRRCTFGECSEETHTPDSLVRLLPGWGGGVTAKDIKSWWH